MRRQAFEDEPIAYEPVPVTDTFVTGMLPVEDRGGVMRLTLVADRIDGRGAIERTIVARLVMGREAMVECGLSPLLDRMAVN